MTRGSPRGPLLDVYHWQLLSCIVCCSDPEGSQRIRAWLKPLLNRIPLAPIFTTILDQLPCLPAETQATVFISFTSCFSVLWPLARHKMNAETLLECFSSTLKVLNLNTDHDLVKPRATVCSAVANTYLSAVARTPNSKKVGAIYLPSCALHRHNTTQLSSAFLSSHLEHWLRCIPIIRRLGLDDLYAAGAETLFVPGTLRQLVDDPVSNPVIQALSRLNPTTILPSLSTLLKSLHDFMARNRADLFSRLQQEPRITANHVQESIINFYNACDELICVSHVAAPEMWDARLRLLSVVEEKNVFFGAQDQSTSILSEKCRLAVAELRSRQSPLTHDIL